MFLSISQKMYALQSVFASFFSASVNAIMIMDGIILQTTLLFLVVCVLLLCGVYDMVVKNEMENGVFHETCEYCTWIVYLGK